MSILFIAHTDENGALPKAALETLTAVKSLAVELGAPFSVGLFGADVKAAADSIGACGAEAFFGVGGEAFGPSRYATDAAACAALCTAAKAAIVVGPATPRLSRCLPGAAYRLGGRIDTNLTALDAKDGKPLPTRWYYRQRMFGQVERDPATFSGPWALTLSSGCFAPADCAGPAVVQAVDVPLDGLTRTTVTGLKTPAADAQTIRPDAKLLLVAGAGWTKKQADGQPHVKEAGELILGFLDKTKGSLGSSKSLVDLGSEGHDVLNFLTHLHQVGQTGATPRHPKGLATCCHGEEPHVVGWRFINERRAVNLDAGCGWAHGKADVLYVADAFAVMKKVNELLGQ
ncbi:electron transfer flavoprotein subunit alpha/FixB family protein [Paucidesulfovibrio longus]|uniref:electron transfer flavoprotein subunit alpha/FixB family protein n=1 Tax=Paucidesulfovibrio longus TaxID=889 RepID=UPI0003B6A367|nr:electron transfer flavoprotein subunit alpha [Paucidesulfovibrio longus]